MKQGSSSGTSQFIKCNSSKNFALWLELYIVIYVPLGTLYPSTTTSSDDAFTRNGATGYNLIVSLIHIVM